MSLLASISSNPLFDVDGGEADIFDLGIFLIACCITNKIQSKLKSITVQLYFAYFNSHIWRSLLLQNQSLKTCYNKLMEKIKQKRKLSYCILSQSHYQGEGVIAHLLKNVYQQNKIDFYLGLATEEIEHLLTAVLRPNQLPIDQQQFIVGLIKRNSFIVGIAFGRQDFKYSYLFGFLDEKDISYEKLNALQEMLLPFCKKFPQKFLKLLADNTVLKDILLKRLYSRQIFKIVYTAIFCCSSSHVEEMMLVIRQLTHHLINSIFQFSPLNKNKYCDIHEYGQVAYNLKDFLSDLTINLSSVELNLIQCLIQILNSDFLGKLVEYFIKLKDTKQYEQYCEGLIMVPLNLIKLLQTFKLFSYPHNNESNLQIRNTLQQLLCKHVKVIAGNIAFYTSYLLQQNQRSINFSSGECIPRVGMIRYRMLQLIQKLLSINELQNMCIDYNSFDLLPVIEMFLQKFRWNNLIHNLLVKITQLILSQDYVRFKTRHIEKIQTHGEGIFGSLMINFRNRKYIFLHSMRMANQGNRDAIFQISKNLINQMQEGKDLTLLIQKFKLWKQFMQYDMKQYQKMDITSQHFDELMLESNSQSKNNSLNQFPREYKSNNKTLETIAQIVNNMREGDLWSPLKYTPTIDKKIFMESEIIKQMDSIRHL